VQMRPDGPVEQPQRLLVVEPCGSYVRSRHGGHVTSATATSNGGFMCSTGKIEPCDASRWPAPPV
jgi:hypothetical protein